VTFIITSNLGGRVKKKTSKAQRGPASATRSRRTKPHPHADDRARRERIFIKEYLANGFRGGEAAIAAGYTPDRSRITASELLASRRVCDAIEQEIAEREKRLQLKADDVVRMAWAIATADARELSRTERGCCRHCWGKDNGYQRTPMELKLHRKAFELKVLEKNPGKSPEELADLLDLFDSEGGVGWNPKLDPNPKCQECHGDGELSVVFSDLRDVSPAARLLFAGVKKTDKGLEIKMRDRDALLIKVGEHLGAFRRKVEVTGKNGGPIQQEHALLAELVDAVEGAETGIDRSVAAHYRNSRT
jgi:phage terminase small subunit